MTTEDFRYALDAISSVLKTAARLGSQFGYGDNAHDEARRLRDQAAANDRRDDADYYQDVMDTLEIVSPEQFICPYRNTCPHPCSFAAPTGFA